MDFQRVCLALKLVMAACRYVKANLDLPNLQFVQDNACSRRAAPSGSPGRHLSRRWSSAFLQCADGASACSPLATRCCLGSGARCCVMKLGIPTGEINGIGVRGRRLIGERREEGDLGARFAPVLQKVRVGKREGDVAGDGDALAEGR